MKCYSLWVLGSWISISDDASVGPPRGLRVSTVRVSTESKYEGGSWANWSRGDWQRSLWVPSQCDTSSASIRVSIRCLARSSTEVASCQYFIIQL